MERDEGMRILAREGWLSATPVDFQRGDIVALHRKHLETGDRITAGR